VRIVATVTPDNVSAQTRATLDLITETLLLKFALRDLCAISANSVVKSFKAFNRRDRRGIAKIAEKIF
jgi:hypothetical protein